MSLVAGLAWRWRRTSSHRRRRRRRRRPPCRSSRTTIRCRCSPPRKPPPRCRCNGGRSTLHPHLDYQFSYGNGIQSSPGQQQNSIVQQVSPGILFNLGDHWTLDYTPTLNFYSSSRFQKHGGSLRAIGLGNGLWRLVFQRFTTLMPPRPIPNIETAAQTDQQTYSTALNAAYQFNDKMSLDMGLSQNFNYVGNGTSSHQTTCKIWRTPSRGQRWTG